MKRIPERMDIETDWRASTPSGRRVTVELWGDRGRRDAEVRAEGALIGTLTAAAGDIPVPDRAAVQEYGPEWVDAQLRSAAASLAIRWAESAFRR